MDELNLSGGISPVAVTDPFPLFTREAVVEMRRDILSDKVLDEYRVSSKLAKCQAREYNKLVSILLHFSQRKFLSSCSP